MYPINEIFRNFGSEYIQRFGKSMPNEHRKVIDAIIACRTLKSGLVIYECSGCGAQHISLRSCGNRHCPACQNHKTRQWVKNQMDQQLPGHHFMITFTVPEHLRGFIRSNKLICYTAMFHGSSETMKKLSADTRHIGGDQPGFFGVLHTWGRKLQYHPHIHYIVPGGAILKEDGSWHPSRTNFYLPVKAMSKVFKAKFCEEMKKAGLWAKIPSNVWEMDWNVNCQAVGNSKNCIKYLSAYVFKVAISDSRILKVENREVFFRYRKVGSKRWRTMKLDVMEFIRRFLQHVLPTGFMKIRYYGFMHPSCAISIEDVRTAMDKTYQLQAVESDTETEAISTIVCPHCGGKLKYLCSVLPFQMIPSPGEG